MRARRLLPSLFEGRQTHLRTRDKNAAVRPGHRRVLGTNICGIVKRNGGLSVVRLYCDTRTAQDIE